MSRKYSEDQIKTLKPFEHIRLRPGMYIGRLGDGSNVNDGIYILFKEVLDNSVDEFISGYGNKIEIFRENRTIRIRDYGRGIPLGKLKECVSEMNTGGKYNDEAFQFSVGLNGVGTKAVNALSSSFIATSYRDGKYSTVSFEGGKLVKEKKGSTKEQNGTEIEFTPDDDKEIFGDYEYNDEYIIQRLYNYAYLNTGLSLYYNGTKYYSKDGLMDLLSKEVDNENVYPIIHFKSRTLEFALTHTTSYGETFFSYVNGQYTNDGGTHLTSFKEGILKGINEYYKSNYSAQDVREGIIGTIAIKLQSPIFESQTKNKLGNTDIRGPIVQDVKNAIVDYLLKNSDVASSMEEKIKSNEKLRKELTAVKKNAKEKSKKTRYNIPKLKDCKTHLGQKGGEDSMIFITEGDSASGSMVSARNVFTQAIFGLKGKPQNLFGKKQTDIYKNEELFNLMKALGIENDIEDLRYNKIIIATDADVDGFHIRLLLLTYFLSFFSELVTSERIFILETPLFRVRNKNQTIYCYSEKEKEEAREQIRGSEVTRFKGLGEISPKEFGQFIGEDMRLTPVTLSSAAEMHKTLNFYMGNNTPERKDFIMENII